MVRFSALLLLVSSVPLWAQPPSEAWTEVKLDDRKIPTTEAEARAQLVRLDAALLGLAAGPQVTGPARDALIKEQPLIAGLDQQRAELQLFAETVRDGRVPTTLAEEEARQLLDAIQAVREDEARAKAALENRTVPERYDAIRLEVARVELARLRAKASVTKELVERLTRRKPEDVLKEKKDAVEQVRAQRATKLDELQRARDAGEAAKIIVAREEVHALGLRVARLDLEARVLEAEADRLVLRRRIEKAQAEASVVQLEIDLQEWLIAEMTRLERREQRQRGENDPTWYEAEKSRDHPAYAAYYDLELDRLRLSVDAVREIGVTEAWERPFGGSGDVALLLREAARIQTAIASDASGEAGLLDASELRELRNRCREHAEEAEGRLARLREQRERDRREIKKLSRDLEALPDRVDAVKRSVEAAAVGQPAPRFPIDWVRLTAGMQAEASRRKEQLEKRLTKFRDHLEQLLRLLDDSSKSLWALERRLLWVRDESAISMESLDAAWVHLSSGVPTSMAAWAGLEVAGVRRRLARDGLGRFLAAILLIAGSIVLPLWLRARHSITIESVTRGAPRGRAALRAAAYVLLRSAPILLPGLGLVAAGFLLQHSPRFLAGVAVIATTPGIFFALRCANRLAFDPLSSERRLFPIEDGVARSVHRSLSWALFAGLLIVPLGLFLEFSGYRDENPGFLELLWLVWKGISVLALLRTVLRPSVIRSVLSGSGTVASSLRRALIFAYPVVMIVLLALLIASSLRYTEAVDVLGTWFSRSFGVIVVGYLLYGILRRAFVPTTDLDVVLAPDDFETRDAFEVAGRTLFFGRLARLAVLGAVLGTVIYVVYRLWPLEGVHISDAALGGVSLGDAFTAILVMVLSVIVLRVCRGLLQFVLLPGTGLDRGAQYAILALTSYGLAAAGLVIALKFLNVGGDQIAWVMSALAVGIGFGLQSLVRNLVSGIILLIERPVRVGDLVDLGGRTGRVDRITIRATTVMTHDNVGVVIPNEELIGGRVVNASLGADYLRTDLSIGVAYGSDVPLVRKVIMEAVQKHGLVLKRPAPEVFFVGFGESSLDFELRLWTKVDAHRLRVSSDVRFALEAGFRRNGIEVPFPQRDLHLRSMDPAIAAAWRASAETGMQTSGVAADAAPAAESTASSKETLPLPSVPHAR